MFFDEIHESSSSFKPELIGNLSRWKDLVHKALVLSATFTEPSYLVTSFVSALTNNAIEVYNYERKKISNPARLHLRYTKARFSNKDLTPIHSMIGVILNARVKSKKVHIYTGSKSLTDELTNAQSGDMLSKYICDLSPNVLTSDTNTEFDSTQMNIGTRFGTGVNIDSDAVFIILVPNVIPDEIGTYGTFSNGYSSIIQTLARVRGGGEIFVYSALPYSLIEGDYLKTINGNPSFLNRHEVADHHLEDEFELIKNHYEEEYSNMDSFQDDGSFKEFMEVQKPNFNKYVLLNGHSKLVQSFESYGKGITPYLLKSAIQNQFCNCDLKSIQLIDRSEQEKEVRDSTGLAELIHETTLAFLEFYDDAEAFSKLLDDMEKSIPKWNLSNVMNEDSVADVEWVPTQPLTAKEEEFVKDPITKELVKASHTIAWEVDALKQKNKIVYKGAEVSDRYKRQHPFINVTLIELLHNKRFGAVKNYSKEVYIRGSMYQAFAKAGKSVIRRELSKVDKERIKLVRSAYKDLEKVRKRFLKEVAKKESEPIGPNLIDKGTERMLCNVLTILKKGDHFISNNIFSFLRALTFKYNRNGDVVYTGACVDSIKRKEIICRELKKLFVKPRVTTRAGKKVQVFDKEIPLEKDTLRLFEY